MNNLKMSFVFCLYFAGCLIGFTQENNIQEVTVITSQKLTFDYHNRFALFEENVRVQDKELNLTADLMDVRFDAEGDVTFIKATGHVLIRQEGIIARSSTATYEINSGKIVLEGDPQVQRGRDLLLGDRITFWRDDNRLECYPNAKLVIVPDEEEKEEGGEPFSERQGNQ